MVRIILTAITVAGLAAGAASAQSPVSPKPADRPAQLGPPLAFGDVRDVTGATGKLVKRSPLPSGDAVRQRRRFRDCNREARSRKLKGALRRSFVARCRLGYGFRLPPPRSK